MITAEEFIATIHSEKDLWLRVRRQEGLLAAAEVVRAYVPDMPTADITALLAKLPKLPSDEALRYLAMRECESRLRAISRLSRQSPNSKFETIKRAIDALPDESRLKRVLSRRKALV